MAFREPLARRPCGPIDTSFDRSLFLMAFDEVPTSSQLFKQLAWLWAVLWLVIVATLLTHWVVGIPSAPDFARARLAGQMARAEAALRGTSSLSVASFASAPKLGADSKLYQTLERLMHARSLLFRGKAGPLPIALVPPDFATNPLHASFPPRATGATLACYLIMTGLDWGGIHTCMVICAAKALVTAEAQVRKQALRITGAFIGGARGIAVVVSAIQTLIPYLHCCSWSQPATARSPTPLCRSMPSGSSTPTSPISGSAPTTRNASCPWPAVAKAASDAPIPPSAPSAYGNRLERAAGWRDVPWPVPPGRRRRAHEVRSDPSLLPAQK